MTSTVPLEHLLVELAQMPPSEIIPEALSALAKTIWYGPVASADQFAWVLEKGLSEPLHKRRALYLIDTLRRFSCVDEPRAIVLRDVVAQGGAFKPFARSAAAAERVSAYQLHRLAHEWGLEEDVCKQMQHVLQFQTRHYAATQVRAPTPAP
ncbi:hypothetical protein [Pseudomonas putida]